MSAWQQSKEVFTASVINGLYLIDKGQQAYAITATADAENLSEAEVWHRRLAHTNYQDIERLVPVSKGIKFA